MFKNSIKNTILLLVLVISFTLFSRCKKDPTIITSNNSIIGTWIWVKSIEPRTGFITTPASEGFNETRIFMVNDTVEIYIDDNIKYKYHYEFKYWNLIDPTVPNTDSTLMLIINEVRSFYSIDNDTLIISYAYVDGHTNYYKRQQ